MKMDHGTSPAVTLAVLVGAIAGVGIVYAGARTVHKRRALRREATPKNDAEKFANPGGWIKDGLQPAS